MADTTLADAEATAIALLRNDADVIDMSATVSVGMIGYDRNIPWLRVRRTGGTPTLWMLRDVPEIEVAAYGPDSVTALDLAIAARRALFAAIGVTYANQLICDARDAQGLALDPDENDTTLWRYTFKVALVTKAA